MLDQLLDIGKDQLSELIKEKTGLDTTQAGQSVDIAGESIMDGFKSEVAGGNISGLMELFTDKNSVSTSNPIISNIAGGFVKNLVSKLGVSDSVASMISGIAVPFIISKFSDKASSEGGMQDLVSSFMDQNGDGKTDMSDLLSGFLNSQNKGGSSSNKGDNPLGGIADMLGGFLKK